MTDSIKLCLLVFSGALAGCGFPATVSAPPPLPAVAGAASESVASGREAFVAKCNGCHGYPSLTATAEDKWSDIMHRMGPKSGLSAKQTEDVLHFVVAARAATKAP